MVLCAQRARQLTCKCFPGGVSYVMSCGNWRTSLFQDKWPYCVLFFLSQLISHSQTSRFGRSTGVGKRKSIVLFCFVLYLATTVSQGISEYHLPSGHLVHPGSEHRVTVQGFLAKPAFLDLFLVKFVGGGLAFPLSDGCVESPWYFLQRCLGWPVLGWGERTLIKKSLKIDRILCLTISVGGLHQKLLRRWLPCRSRAQLWAVSEARRSPLVGDSW